MLHTIPIEQTSEELVALVRALHPGDQIVLTDGEQRVARIMPEPETRKDRQAGLCKGMLDIISDDPDDILEHFKDYVP